jgi:hypothetical protein
VSRTRTPEQRARQRERERARRAALSPEDLELVRARDREEKRRERANAKGVEYEEDAHRAARVVLMPAMDRTWLKGAACAGMDPLLFWHPTERRNADRNITDLQLLRDQRTAARTCDACPVQRPCYSDGLTTGATGIWGGRLLGGVNNRNDQPINLINRLHEGRLYRKEQAA